MVAPLPGVAECVGIRRGRCLVQQLRQLKRLLRAGFHPLDFGAELIGDGAQRKAFLFGDYVIKRRCPAWMHDRRKDADGPLNDDAKPCARRALFRVPVKALRRIGVMPPTQWVVGEWVIQYYYRELTKSEQAEWEWLMSRGPRWQNIKLDVYGNIGIDLRTGAVTAFDW
jgi:hypothetical protein